MNVDIPCICPPVDGQPRHDHDTITLRDHLDFHAATTIRNSAVVLRAEDPDAGVAEVMATFTEQYVIFGVEAWTLVDDRGKPVPVTRPAIRDLLLTRDDVSFIVADAADGMYQEKVILPLLPRESRPSPTMSTNGSISATNGTRSTPRKRSSRSSTSTIPTGDTGTTGTSLAGASSS